MDAEGLSQTILLEIIQNIDKGARINNLDYYIWGVCKNQYNIYLRKTIKDRNTLEYKEEIDEADDSKTALDEMLEDEKIRRMNQAIKLLSKDYAEILYAYYVEDKTLKFIAEELNIPLGTVCRRLSDIRQKLKEYLDMEKINGKKAFVPKKFSTAMSGGGKINPHMFTKSLINKNILFHSYDNPCTLEDYSLELGISIPYIEEIVGELVGATLLIKEGNKYITNFPIITKETSIKLYSVIKAEGKLYGQMLVKFAEKYFSKFKEIINNDHFTENELMWVFMFYINRIAEQYPINEEDSWIEPKRRHIDSRGSWDFHMEEEYQMDRDYPISERWFGNSQLGIQGICYPTSYYDCKETIFKTICYSNCINGTGDIDNFELEYVEYVIKNKSMKYSEVEASQKYKVDYLIDNNYVYVENDEIKFNFVVLSALQYEKLNGYFEYHLDLTNVKQQRNKIIEELKKIVVSILPSYLSDDVEYLSSSYFYGFIREYVVRAFAEKELIKPNDKNNRFNFNAYAWTFEK